ncbi:hypothetical protein DL96DRAFT_1589095 [Flagelloscypha sp. PMI_526]|nr:hypothetical protein DL96DRAFT_1589095 [Flagelloscypha sp. PMI_526]
MENGADPNLQLSVGEYGSALTAAASGGELGVTKCLVDKGADPNLHLKVGEYGSALAAAKVNGRSNVAEFLAVKGAVERGEHESGSS